MKNKTLMVQGTTSDAGKSMLVTALGRWLQRSGVSVAPFKPQNMALNSAVTEDGGEVGRAQAVQAEACGLLPHTDFNPILLKPNSDIGAQVIVHGHSIGNMDAVDYHQYKSIAHQAVMESHERLCSQFDAVIVEGAGSPAEINLRDRDIANMGFAEAADCPVIIIADIDRGGVFAHLVGTLDLLSESEQQRVIGFVINRFRGDIKLLESGLEWLEQRTGKPVIGVLPYLLNLHLEAEDAIQTQQPSAQHAITVAVPVLPRISNHTDLDALRLHPQVNLQFVAPGAAIPPADLIILPGSKSVRQDLATLRDHGWNKAIASHLRYGGKLIGICGGFQMLGQTIADPLGIEGTPGTSNGLGYLELSTTLAANKQLRNVSGTLQFAGAKVKGYEIHAGETYGEALQSPLIISSGGNDGAISADNQILGSYWHGLFDSPEACKELLQWAGLDNAETPNFQQRRNETYDRLADMVEAHLDTAILRRALNLADKD